MAGNRATVQNAKPAPARVGPFSVPAASHLGLIMSSEKSEASLDTGATANLACFKLLQRHNSLQAKSGAPAAEMHPGAASFNFGNVRLEQVRYAADVPVAIAGRRGMFTALPVDADIPASSRKRGIGDNGRKARSLTQLLAPCETGF